MADTCPSWCTRNHETGDVHLTVRHAPGAETWVSLTRTVIGDLLRIHNEFAGTSHQLHRHFIHVTWRDPERSVIRPIAEAGQFAEMAEAFGRPDIAALIRELAALAKGNPDG